MSSSRVDSAEECQAIPFLVISLSLSWHFRSVLCRKPYVKYSFIFFGNAGFLVFLIIVLIVALYYYRSKASAHRAMTQSLTQQLILEAEDKQFLLSRLTAHSKPQSVAAM